MRRIVLILAFCQLGLVLGGCDGGSSTPEVQQPTEVSYEGKTLTQWLAALDAGPERQGALRALRTMRPDDPRVVPAVADCLGDANATTRELAGATLATIGDAGLAAAAKKLTGGNASEQKGAAAALAAAGTRGVAPLVDALASPSESVRSAAGEALQGMGASATEALEQAMRSGSREQRIAALQAMSELAGDDALVEALGDKMLEETARAALIERGEDARPALERGAKGLGAGPQARELLALLDAERAREIAGRFATGGDVAVQKAVALGPVAVDAIVPLLGDANETVRNNAVSALAQIGYAAEAPANERLVSIKAEEREAAANVLIGIGSESAQRFLALALGSDNAATRATVSAALVDAKKDNLGRDVLILGLIEGNAAAKREAAKGMVACEAPGIAALQLAALTAAKDVRLVAVDALDQAGEPANRALVNLLENDDAEVGTLVVEAVRKRGAAVVPRLLERASKASWKGRDRAIEVLRSVAKTSVDELIAAALSADDSRSALARELLKPLGRDVVTKLKARSGDADAGVRASAAQTLVFFAADVPEAARILGELIADDSADVRYAAALGLGRLETLSKDQKKALAVRLRDPDGRVKVAAAGALIKSNPKDKRARSALAAAWKDDDEVVRVAALNTTYATTAGGARMQAVYDGLDPDQPVAVRRIALTMLQGQKTAVDWIRPIQRAMADKDSAIAAAGKAIYDELTKDPWISLGESRFRRLSTWNAKQWKWGKQRREAVALALEWLKNHQSANGSWDVDGFRRECKLNRCDGTGIGAFDPGVTGIALLCFLANGNTPSQGPYKDVVKKGLQYLISTQDSEGCFGPRTAQSYQYNHAFASLAMVEAYMLTGSRAVKEPAQRAVNFIHRSQNPYLAWRYGVRDGDNDTSVTGCMVAVLRAAREAELEFDRGALRGAVGWIEKMTEPEFGRVGYQARGGRGQRYKGDHDRFPTDLGEPLTAIGLTVRVYSGEDPKKSEYVQKHANIVMKRTPDGDFDSGAIDTYYWYWGSLAMHEMGKKAAAKWDEKLLAAAAEIQRTESARDERGSFDPAGAWSAALGRVGSTALVCLALQTPWRYPREFSSR